jgi:hypothetical protein
MTSCRGYDVILRDAHAPSAHDKAHSSNESEDGGGDAQTERVIQIISINFICFAYEDGPADNREDGCTENVKTNGMTL